MRRARLPICLALLAFASVPSGCAERHDRLVGNERVIRGPGGLGTTTRTATVVDRDTYAAAGSADRGATLLAGREGSFEARSLLSVASWSLPDATDPTLAIDSIRFELNLDDFFGTGTVELGLWTAAAAWDSMSVAWPGPALGTSLGTGTPLSQPGPFAIHLGAGAFDMVKSWALNPSSIPGFVLAPVSGQGVAAFTAGTGRFRIYYRHTVSGTARADSATSAASADLFVSTPIAPAPTGSDTTLVLGGLYRSSVLVRAPAPSFTEGHSLNESRLVLRIAPGSPAFAESVVVNVRAHRIRNAWAETVTDDAGLGVDAAPLASVGGFRVAPGVDSLVIEIPAALVREWSLNPASNEGILLRVDESFRAPEILVSSRESSRPPQLFVSTTGPPPGRF